MVNAWSRRNQSDPRSLCVAWQDCHGQSGDLKQAGATPRTMAGLVLAVPSFPTSPVPSHTLCFPLHDQQCPPPVPLHLALLLLFIALHIHCDLFGSECDKLHIWAFLKSEIFVESNTWPDSYSILNTNLIQIQAKRQDNNCS